MDNPSASSSHLTTDFDGRGGGRAAWADFHSNKNTKLAERVGKKEVRGMCSPVRTVWADGLVILIGVGLFLSSGCGEDAGYEGPERAAVSGKVTLDGSPLPYGTVTFISTEGEGRRASGLISDGSYSIPEGQGPNLGKCKVEILGFEKAPAAADDGLGEGGEGAEEEDAGDDEGEGESVGPQIIPPQYNAQTTLEADIVSGENENDFPLTSK